MSTTRKLSARAELRRVLVDKHHLTAEEASEVIATAEAHYQPIVQEAKTKNRKLNQENKRLRQQKGKDDLTGLFDPNPFRRIAINYLKAVARFRREKDREGHWASLWFGDMKNFGDINNTLGHAAGDEALKVVASALKKSIRYGDDGRDFPARLGGDEFGALITNLDEYGPVYDAAKRFQKRLDRYNYVNKGLQGLVQIDLGIVCLELSTIRGKDPKIMKHVLAQLMERADELMYKAKAAGHIFIKLYEWRNVELREIAAPKVERRMRPRLEDVTVRHH